MADRPRHGDDERPPAGKRMSGGRPGGKPTGKPPGKAGRSGAPGARTGGTPAGGPRRGAAPHGSGAPPAGRGPDRRIPDGPTRGGADDRPAPERGPWRPPRPGEPGRPPWRPPMPAAGGRPAGRDPRSRPFDDRDRRPPGTRGQHDPDRGPTARRRRPTVPERPAEPHRPAGSGRPSVRRRAPAVPERPARSRRPARRSSVPAPGVRSADSIHPTGTFPPHRRDPGRARASSPRRGHAPTPVSRRRTCSGPRRSWSPAGGRSRRSSRPAGPPIGCSSCRNDAAPSNSWSSTRPGCASRSSRWRAGR